MYVRFVVLIVTHLDESSLQYVVVDDCILLYNNEYDINKQQNKSRKIGLGENISYLCVSYLCSMSLGHAQSILLVYIGENM